MLYGMSSVKSRAAAKVVSTTTHPNYISVPLDLLQAVLIQPSLPVPSASKTVWSTFGRAHSSFAALSTAAVLAATAHS